MPFAPGELTTYLIPGPLVLKLLGVQLAMGMKSHEIWHMALRLVTGLSRPLGRQVLCALRCSGGSVGACFAARGGPQGRVCVCARARVCVWVVRQWAAGRRPRRCQGSAKTTWLFLVGSAWRPVRLPKRWFCLTCLHAEKSIAMLGALALRFRSWRDIEAYLFRSVSCLASCLVFGLEPVWARYLTKPSHCHICARSFSINSHGFEPSRKASFSSLPSFLLANKAESVP